MLVQSAYNVMVPLDETSNDTARYYALFNTLAGAIDVIDEPTAQSLHRYNPTQTQLAGEYRSSNFIPITDLVPDNHRSHHASDTELSPDVERYLERRGYLFLTRQEEQEQSRVVYNTMMDFHRQAVRQPLVVIPSYNCDLKCPYCWQRLYDLDSPIMREEIVDHLFGILPAFVDGQRPDRVDLIIFGGEPLQDIPALRERVLQLLTRARQVGFSTKIISNGVGLAPNVPYLTGKVDVIQVTIDGIGEVHRRRRPLPSINGQTQDSFAPLVEGVTRAVEAGIHINIRINTDEVNLYTLPELSDFMRAQGWLDSGLVKAHLAPVKNHNPRKQSKSESELLRAVRDLVAQDERMAIYDLTGFPGIKYFEGFKETGLFSLHRFFNCEAQINFFAFDLYGDIYSCWDAAGLKHLAVGKFYPEIAIDPDRLALWRHRSSLDIAGCQGCASSPHCGGGCQFLALEHQNTFLASNCDSMMEGYVESISDNAAWLLSHARAGDHAVGFVTAAGVITAVNRPFGLLEGSSDPADLPISCG